MVPGHQRRKSLLSEQHTHIRQGPDLRLVAAVVAVAVVILVVRSLFGRADAAFFADTDDAMRMVVVRDFLAGQGWYDHLQYRLNTPHGAEIHWSRLVDVPLAALLALFTPLLGAAQAMVAVGYVWPMLLLVVLLWVSASLANRLVGPEGVLPALVLPVLSPAITAEFTPGRVDHHNVVILLTLVMVWTGVESFRRPRFAIAGGLAAATALAIATEALPAIGAAIVVAGLVYVFDAARAATMRNFGLACDVLSPVYVLMAMAVAAAFTLVSLVPAPRAAWQRLALLAVLGSLAMLAVVMVYPQCLKGPYGGMDPWLQANWLAAINEAKPWHLSLRDIPAYALAVGTPALLGLCVVLVRLWLVREDRPAWTALLVFLAAMAVIMLFQVRGSRLAVMPAMPAAAWLIVALRRRYLATHRILPMLGLLGSWLAFSGIVLSLAVVMVVNSVPGRAQQVAAARASKEPCLMPAAFADLGVLPPERLMTPIDLGAHTLLYTPHEVVSAPYHRNEQGVRDTFRFFNDPIDAARAILEARGIGLVVLCPAMAEVVGLPSRAPDSFATLFAQDRLPAWLDDVSLPGGALKVYAVLPR
jgi:hypothetical protein